MNTSSVCPPHCRLSIWTFCSLKEIKHFGPKADLGSPCDRLVEASEWLVKVDQVLKPEWLVSFRNSFPASSSSLSSPSSPFSTLATQGHSTHASASTTAARVRAVLSSVVIQQRGYLRKRLHVRAAGTNGPSARGPAMSSNASSLALAMPTDGLRSWKHQVFSRSLITAGIRLERDMM